MIGPRIQGLTGELVSYVKSNEEVHQIIENYIGDKNDHIKSYNAILPSHYYLLLNQAREKGISVVGHRPKSVSALKAIDLGQKSFEHGRVFIYESYDKADSLRNEYFKYYSDTLDTVEDPKSHYLLNDLVDRFSEVKFDSLVNKFIERNTWYCPTLVTMKASSVTDKYKEKDKALDDQIGPVWRLKWHINGSSIVDFNLIDKGSANKKLYAKSQELTKRVSDLGVKILAGSDLPDTDSYFGVGLHKELEELVKAGLSPIDALKTATINPAIYYGQEGTHGSLDIGKKADILLLDNNPLKKISNTRQINYVIFEGQLYDSSELNQLRNYVEKLVNRWNIIPHLIKSQLK